MEIWENVIGYKPIYQVSNKGRVRSISRITNCNSGKGRRKERILRQSRDYSGYQRVYLYSCDGKKHTTLVHRLVAKAFVPNPFSYAEVDHIDGDKQNNGPDNLRWLTHQKNCSNPVTSVKQKRYIDDLAKHKKKICAFDMNGNFIGEWPTITRAAKETNTNRHSISYAANGKYKTSNNLIWRYND